MRRRSAYGALSPISFGKSGFRIADGESYRAGVVRTVSWKAPVMGLHHIVGNHIGSKEDAENKEDPGPVFAIAFYHPVIHNEALKISQFEGNFLQLPLGNHRRFLFRGKGEFRRDTINLKNFSLVFKGIGENKRSLTPAPLAVKVSGVNDPADGSLGGPLQVVNIMRS